MPGFESAYDMLLNANGIDGEAYIYADRHPDTVAVLKDALESARREFYPLRTRPPEKTYPE